MTISKIYGNQREGNNIVWMACLMLWDDNKKEVSETGAPLDVLTKVTPEQGVST